MEKCPTRIEEYVRIISTQRDFKQQICSNNRSIPYGCIRFSKGNCVATNDLGGRNNMPPRMPLRDAPMAGGSDVMSIRPIDIFAAPKLFPPQRFEPMKPSPIGYRLSVCVRHMDI